VFFVLDDDLLFPACSRNERQRLSSRPPKVPLLSCGRIRKRRGNRWRRASRGASPRATGTTAQVATRRGRQLQQLVGQRPLSVDRRANTRPHEGGLGCRAGFDGKRSSDRIRLSEWIPEGGPSHP
jgi:hypothetical protein